ncbi:MAG: hypothetical protein ACQESR_10875 [Planctomycetota bacterium]
MESCSTQGVLPLVGLAADKVIRDRYTGCKSSGGRANACQPAVGWNLPVETALRAVRPPPDRTRPGTYPYRWVWGPIPSVARLSTASTYRSVLQLVGRAADVVPNTDEETVARGAGAAR